MKMMKHNHSICHFYCNFSVFSLLNQTYNTELSYPQFLYAMAHVTRLENFGRALFFSQKPHSP